MGASRRRDVMNNQESVNSIRGTERIATQRGRSRASISRPTQGRDHRDSPEALIRTKDGNPVGDFVTTKNLLPPLCAPTMASQQSVDSFDPHPSPHLSDMTCRQTADKEPYMHMCSPTSELCGRYVRAEGRPCGSCLGGWGDRDLPNRLVIDETGVLIQLR